MFTYCLNCPANYNDSNGHDAIWVHESDNARGFGHSGLLVEDEESGEWYFFYWGPVNDEEDPLVLATVGAPCYFVLVRVHVGGSDLHSVKGVQEILNNLDGDFFQQRAEAVTDIYYLEGDYSATLRHLQNMGSKDNLRYHLLLNNCVQRTWIALSCSDRSFSINSCPVIPDVAYATMLAIRFQYGKSAAFIYNEAVKATCR